MSETKTYTEKEVIMRERLAFVEGALHGAVYSTRPMERYANDAAHRYPLPKVTRPRVVEDAYGNRYRIVDGALEHRDHDGTWSFIINVSCNTAELRDLLANPTEEVEDA